MEAIGKTIQRNVIVSEHTEQLKKVIQEKEESLRLFKCYIQISYEQFKELLSAYATEILIQRAVIKPFVIDKDNGPVIRQLYLYFTNNPDCEWNLNAGILLGGNVGCGKSVLMLSFLRICNEYTSKRTTITHSKQLAGLIKKEGLEYYEKRPMFIDELGREELEAKDYGNVVKPVIDLFSLRYESGARTYGTTNFNTKDLEGIYKNFIVSRMGEMMTLVKLPGESRRLKNEVKTK